MGNLVHARAWQGSHCNERINQSINVELVSFCWTLTPIVQEDENHSSLQISAERLLKEVST